MGALFSGRVDSLMTIFRPALLAISFCVAPLLACPLPAWGQTASTGANAASANANPVSFAVTAFNKGGDVVPSLTPDGLTLTVDGSPQPIQSLRSAAAMPLTVGLLVETGTGPTNTLADERAATQRFVDTMLTSSQSRPSEKAFLIQFAGEVDLLADATKEKGKLDAALGQLGTPQSRNTSADNDSSGGTRLGGAGATLYDAIYLASTELMKKQPDRKALIVLTDGVDRGSKVSLFSTIEAAQRANTAVYAIYFKGKEQRGNRGGSPGQRRGRVGGWPGGGGGGYPGSGGGWPGTGGGGGSRPSRPTEGSRTDGRKILQQICSETGGYLFEVGKKHSVDQIYSALAGGLRGQYWLSFTPDKKSNYGGFHRIALTAKSKDLYIQARQGYYSGD